MVCKIKGKMLIEKKKKKEWRRGRAMVTLAFDPSAWETGRWIFEFEASLVYRVRVSSITARATHTKKLCCGFGAVCVCVGRMPGHGSVII